MSILHFSLFGLGRVLESPLRTSPTSNLSPKISLRYWAIFFCCWMVQWFSMDRITGYLQRWRINVSARPTGQYSYIPLYRWLWTNIWMLWISYNWRKLRCFSVTFIKGMSRLRTHNPVVYAFVCVWARVYVRACVRPFVCVCVCLCLCVQPQIKKWLGATE